MQLIVYAPRLANKVISNISDGQRQFDVTWEQIFKNKENYKNFLKDEYYITFE